MDRATGGTGCDSELTAAAGGMNLCIRLSGVPGRCSACPIPAAQLLTPRIMAFRAYGADFH